MIPSPWVAIILALGTFRICRLLGWDTWPYVVRFRHWLGGRNERNRGVKVFAEDERGTYTRPTVAKFLVCAWCFGFWAGCVVYVVWLYAPTAVLYALVPFALNTVVGLIATRLDQ